MLAPITFRSMLEHAPGEKLRKEFEYRWPAYRHWYLGDGNDARPGIDECLREFRAHMPELVPTLEQLTQLFGNDELVVRFLTLYRPPPIFKGCSQAIWLEPVKALIRNYDFPAHNWESIQLLSAWNGNPVMAMSDCIWGALDGINSYGLAVSLSFGGRSITGPGFGITIVLRYILEFATCVEEAVEILKRVPVSMAYNVSLIDRHGDYRTVMLAPDTGITVTRSRWATNHQELSTENNSFFFAESCIRGRFLSMRLGDRKQQLEHLKQLFLMPPLYRAKKNSKDWDTLYTAIYYPDTLEMELLWPERSFRQSLSNFQEPEFPLWY